MILHERQNELNCYVCARLVCVCTSSVLKERNKRMSASQKRDGNPICCWHVRIGQKETERRDTRVYMVSGWVGGWVVRAKRERCFLPLEWDVGCFVKEKSLVAVKNTLANINRARGWSSL